MLPVSISFPGMRQPYFYSQTVSVEFSTLRENLFRQHSSFTLYFPLLLYFPFSFNFPSALFPILLYFPSSLIRLILLFSPSPYFSHFSFIFIFLFYFSSSLPISPSRSIPFFALLSSLSYFLSPFISLRFNFPLIPYFPPFFIFPSLYVTSYCTFSSSFIFPVFLFPFLSFLFSPLIFSSLLYIPSFFIFPNSPTF